VDPPVLFGFFFFFFPLAHPLTRFIFSFFFLGSQDDLVDLCSTLHQLQGDDIWDVVDIVATVLRPPKETDNTFNFDLMKLNQDILAQLWNICERSKSH